MIQALYGVILLWQMVWLVLAIRRKRGWVRLLILTGVSMVLAFVGVWYFNAMPGYGFMPGLAFFPEFFYSLLAGVVYFIMTLIACVGALMEKSRK